MFDYDAFLSHASQDEALVEIVARKLSNEHRLGVFFALWKLVPGAPWQEALEQGLRSSRTCLIFLGPDGFGPWHSTEMRTAMGQRVAEEPKRVIPVLLPGAREDALPDFLAQRTWVDLRNGVEDETAFGRLVAGIRGVAPQTNVAVLKSRDRLPKRNPRRSPRKSRFSSAYFGITIGILLTALAWWFPQATSQSPEIYDLRFQILDPEARPVNGATVSVSSGNKPHLLPDGWWQVKIPRTKLRLDQKVTLWAEHPKWTGTREVLQLGADPNPQLEVRLEVPKERISGVVIDAANRAVSGARVSLRNQPGSATVTDQDGHFELWITGARTETTRLHVEHPDYQSQDGSCYVGRDGCPLVLETE